MSPWKTPNHDWYPCFPRVSGDEPDYWSDISSYELFSPRERG